MMKNRREYGVYTKELRKEAARLVVDEKLPFKEVSRRLSLPQSTLENWVRATRAFVITAVNDDLFK